MFGVHRQIARAIREGKWLYVIYLNQRQQMTFYWVAIQDIDPIKKRIEGAIYNSLKQERVLEKASLYVDSIKSAKVLEFTSYPIPLALIDKIENDPVDFAWLGFDEVKENILSYYEECNRLDANPFQKERLLVPGIDARALKAESWFSLNPEQEKYVVDGIIKKYNHIGTADGKDRLDKNSYVLALADLCLYHRNEEYVVCYHDVTFNPLKKALHLDPEVKFNKSFLLREPKTENTEDRTDTPISLFGYVDMNVEDFMTLYRKNPREGIDILKGGLKRGDYIDTRPYLMILEKSITLDLETSYRSIKEQYNHGRIKEFPYPLRAFFGRSNRPYYNHFRNEPDLVLFDRNINIDQVNVLYKAMRYPVNYVQGPPGTGKTQTLLNVVLSAFFSGRTALICSGNNRPVDGIIEKLKLSYKGKEIPFPYLRLGNREVVLSATKAIAKLAQLPDSPSPPFDLDEIHRSHQDKTKQLLVLLDQYEEGERKALQLKEIQKLLGFKDYLDRHMTEKLVEKTQALQSEVSSLPEIRPDEIMNLYVPFQQDESLEAYFYYASLRCLHHLKEPRYQDLLSICNEKDETLRVSAFNQWMKNDENLALLLRAFPVVFTTNISAGRLGTGKTRFSLVIMDEAGQCNVAQAILPIMRGNNLLLVGDTSQLKPVILLDKATNDRLLEKYQVNPSYSYLDNSIMTTMRANDEISNFVFLRYHYRCGKKIISFSNQRYYGSRMNLDQIRSEGRLKLIQVENNVDNGYRNSNEAEADAIVQFVKKYQLTRTTILTPFVNQESLINEKLLKEGITGVHCGTIHSMQGAEDDIIILSPSISPRTTGNAYKWLKDNNEIINVGITRAKKALVLVGDTAAIREKGKSGSNEKDDLNSLIDYMEKNGNTEVAPNQEYSARIGYSNGSKNEAEFYKTMLHFCTVHTNLLAKRNVPVSEVFPDDPLMQTSAQEFDLVLYRKALLRKKYIPLLAIEINGREHYVDPVSMMMDEKKRQLCAKEGIEVVVIHNQDVMDYEYLSDFILDLFKVRKLSL